jgi:hypothetical protein
MIEKDYESFLRGYNDTIATWSADATLLMYHAWLVHLNVDWVAAQLSNNAYTTVYKHIIRDCKVAILKGPGVVFTSDELPEISDICKKYQKSLYRYLINEIEDYCIG